jgi:two-component system, NarL family, response regulator LiaR
MPQFDRELVEMENTSSAGVKQRIRVAVADDFPIVRSGIVVTLAGVDDLEVVGEAANGEQALLLVEQLHPDVVLMDVMMPGMGGIAATKVLHERHPAVTVLALTSFEDGEIVHEALEAGALGYLLKGMEADELVNAIRLAHVGLPSLAAGAAQTLVRQVAKGPPPAGHDLTVEEHAVLELVVAGESNMQIANTLGVSLATVKSHLAGLRHKLGTKTRTELAVFALRHQLVRIGAAEGKR